MHRRDFLQSSAAAIAAPALVGRAHARPIAGAILPIPPLMDVGEGAGNLLEAVKGRHRFAEGVETRTLGWSQDHLGPTLRMQRGRTARLTVQNPSGQGCHGALAWPARSGLAGRRPPFPDRPGEEARAGAGHRSAGGRLLVSLAPPWPYRRPGLSWARRHAPDRGQRSGLRHPALGLRYR